MPSWADSPYVGICIRPRETIRAIVDRHPRDRVIALVLTASVICALTNALNSWHSAAFTDADKAITSMPLARWHKLNFAALILWPLMAVPLLYLNGIFLRWTGRLVGGT